MSSDSSLGVALVTGASTELSHAISLRLAKKFDLELAISDLPGDSKRLELEVLKAQIGSENEGTKGITNADNLKKAYQKVIRTRIKDPIIYPRNYKQDPSQDNRFSLMTGWKAHCELDLDERLKYIYTHAGKQLSERAPDAKMNGILCNVGNGGHYAFMFVIADDKEARGSVSGVMSPLKSAIREITEAAATELGPYGINVNSYFTNLSAVKANTVNELVKDTKVPLANFLGKTVDETADESVETVEDVADVVAFLMSKSARFINGHIFGI